MGRLAQLIARLGTAMPPGLVGGAVAPIVTVVGSTRYVRLPAGVVGRIQMLRDGAPIPGAKSAKRVGDFLYKLQAADNNKAITVQVTDVLQETDGPRRFAMYVDESDPYSVIIEYDETLLSLPSGSAFSMGGVLKTAKANPTVSLFAAGMVKLTYATKFQREDRPRLTYTPPGSNPIRDVLNNLSPAFTNVLVYVKSPDPDPAFVRLESDGSAFLVQGAGGWVSSSSISVSDAQTFAAQVTFDYLVAFVPSQAIYLFEYDYGWVEMRCPDALVAPRGIAFCTSQSTRLTDCAYHVRLSSGSVQAYTIGGVAVGAPYTLPSPSLLCAARLIRDIAGTLHMQTSEDDAQTWTTRHTFSGTYNGTLQGRFYTHSRTVPIIGPAFHGFHHTR